ncbi:Concanavalin A-like lectin/glucanases superfamily [uncultured Caudovirales phage]|uniref:Concanavalin A-like lectin/glucanases superfamily n=1 Tax=uncultured Caudovirales phage TaxID=2100421 RepID=A0A6J5M7J5_9CAUD|nr:Concanavalin A-like lectin/glucanases superfamily [uncultured Caudovirales phage]
MGLAHSPQIVTNGLVFYMDQVNTSKSWRGAPTTNLTSNLGIFAVLSAPTVSYVGLEDGWKKYSLNGTWTGGTYPYSVAIDSVSFTGGVTYSSGVFIRTNVPGKFATLFTGMNYVNEPMNNAGTSFSTAQRDGSFYVGRTGFQYTSTTPQPGYILSQPVIGQVFNSATDFIYIKDGQVETGAFPTPFTSGTRSSTQAILDLTGRNTVNATSLSYTSNGAFSFNGTTSFANTGYDMSWNNTNSATISMILQPDSLSTSRPFIGKTDYEWQMNQLNQALEFVYWNTSGGHTNGPIISVSNFFTSTSSYVHLTLVWNNNDNNIYIYRNGSLVNTTAWTDASINRNITGTVNVGGNIYIWGMGGSYWPGKIDAVSMYSRALTTAEVVQNFNALRGRYGI